MRVAESPELIVVGETVAVSPFDMAETVSWSGSDAPLVTVVVIGTVAVAPSARLTLAGAAVMLKSLSGGVITTHALASFDQR